MRTHRKDALSCSSRSGDNSSKTACLIISLSVLLVFHAIPSDLYAQAADIGPASRAHEPVLFAAGAPTADVLHTGEEYFNIWGWGAHGFTDRLTIVYDWLLVFAGIPYVVLRYQVPLETEKITHAVEVFGFSVPRNEVKAAKFEEFEIYQKGWQAWLHWNTTFRINDQWRVHSSVGATYDTYQRYKPLSGAKFSSDKIYDDYYTLDLALALEYRPNERSTYSINITRGNHLYVYDQNPQRWAIQMSYRFAPFPDRTHGFFRNMRMELWGYYVNFYDVDYAEALPPIFPLIAWQW